MGRTALVGLLWLGFVTQGCGIAVNALRSNGAPGALNTKGDVRIIASTCMVGFDKCESVAMAQKPTDLETWAFTYKEKQTGPYGSPAGEVPITLYVVGEKERCDRAEARIVAIREAGQKESGLGQQPVSESCHGPFYFERDR